MFCNKVNEGKTEENKNGISNKPMFFISIPFLDWMQKEINHEIEHFLKDIPKKLWLVEILGRQLHNLPNGRIARIHFKVRK